MLYFHVVKEAFPFGNNWCSSDTMVHSRMVCVPASQMMKWFLLLNSYARSVEAQAALEDIAQREDDAKQHLILIETILLGKLAGKLPFGPAPDDDDDEPPDDDNEPPVDAPRPPANARPVPNPEPCHQAA
jgi:hypothetical protein